MFVPYDDFLERNLCDLENDKSTMSFVEALLRETAIINPNLSVESVMKAIQDGNLSWTFVENQRKNVVVERLGVIQGFDEIQCCRLFEKLDGMIPTHWIEEKSNAIAAIKNIFYECWLMKCMYSVSKRNDAHVHVLQSFLPYFCHLNSESEGCRRDGYLSQNAKRRCSDVEERETLDVEPNVLLQNTTGSSNIQASSS